MAPLQCRTLLLSPQGRYLRPTPPPGVESGPTPTNQRLSLRHSRPHSADSSEGPTRAISQGWDVDGSLLLLEGLGKSLQLHSGPHLGSGRVQNTISAEQTLQLPVALLASKAEKRSPAYVHTWGLLGAGQGQGAGAGCYRNPVAQYSSVPGSSLCSVIRAQDTSFYELEFSSSQTKPSPSQVPSVGSQGAALSISACQEGAPLSEPPS